MEFISGHLIDPIGLSKNDKNHGFEFYSAWYRVIILGEASSKHITIMYFRNISKKIYGKVDYSKQETSLGVREFANKIIKNVKFRDKYIIKDPDDKIFYGKWS